MRRPRLFRQRLALASIAFLAVATAPAAAESHLVWSDEFEGSSLDLGNWEYMHGDGCQYGSNMCGWGNNELQWYTSRPENISVSAGLLRIIAREDWYQGHRYTSARIRTRNKADFLYGRMEARIRLPLGGQGIWPALWMMPTDNVYGGWPLSGEIDILETVGVPLTAHGTIHFGDPWPHNQSFGGEISPGFSLANDFHVYAIEWEPGVIRWYFDGTHYQTAWNTDWWTAGSPNVNAPFDQEFHFLLNVAVGGNWPGDPDDDTYFPQEMQVDYVRVYELCPTCPFHGAPAQIPGRFEAEDFDRGGQHVAYYDTDPANHGGAYRVERVDIEPASHGGCNVGWIEPGEWLDYTVDVKHAGLFDVCVSVASESTGGCFRLLVNEQDLTGPMEVPVTGGFQVWSHVCRRVELDAGEHRLRFANEPDADGYNVSYFAFYSAADADDDFDVDFIDAAVVVQCLGGPDVHEAPAACGAGAFGAADVDLDGDADLQDVYEVQRSFTGP